MTVNRVTEMVCDLCGSDAFWDSAKEARANGWVLDRWPNGHRVDLCLSCAKEVGRA